MEKEEGEANGEIRKGREGRRTEIRNESTELNVNTVNIFCLMAPNAASHSQQMKPGSL